MAPSIEWQWCFDSCGSRHPFCHRIIVWRRFTLGHARCARSKATNNLKSGNMTADHRLGTRALLKQTFPLFCHACKMRPRLYAWRTRQSQLIDSAVCFCDRFMYSFHSKSSKDGPGMMTTAKKQKFSWAWPWDAKKWLLRPLVGDQCHSASSCHFH